AAEGQPYLLKHPGMPGQDCPAAPGGQELRATKAEDTRIAPRSGRALLARCPRDLSRVLDDRDSVSLGDLHDRRHRDESTVQMRGEDRLGRRSDCGFES